MNTNQILSKVESVYLKKEIPEFRSGDTLKVYVKVVEGESERIQPFEGIVIRRKGSQISETFTVRKTSFGIGVERTFPLHSPRIEKIEVVKSGHSRRARLYYLRKLSGKAARLKEKEDISLVADESSAVESKNSVAPGSQTQTKNSPEPAVSV